jgi:hypothetical protein
MQTAAQQFMSLLISYTKKQTKSQVSEKYSSRRKINPSKPKHRQFF